MIASFDVFDTLVSRIYATPEDVHQHLGEILAQSGLVMNSLLFAKARSQAEAQAWADRGSGKGAAIDEIYVILASRLGWDQEQMRRAMDEEIRLERDAVRPVPDMVQLVEDARRRGRHVCFISDMYLRAEHIRDMLVTLNVLQDGDTLFVSSDSAAIKASGSLFRHAMRTLEIRSQEIHHIGDDKTADYRGARRARISASLYTRAQLNRFETATLDGLGKASWRERSLVAVSKFTRLSRSGDDPDRALWDLLSSTIAPFVAGYALWLIENARRRGIDKLFFLARDMQIVHEVTSYFVRRKGVRLKCIYLYASRNSWQPAGYLGPHDFELFWLTDNVATDKPELILRRLMSTDHFGKIDSILRPVKTASDSWGKREIRELLQSEHVRPAIEQATKEARRALFSYLSQCGYTPTHSCALVDVGWRGSLQNSLARAFHLEGISCEILGFYIGLRHVSHVEGGCTMTPFLGDEVVNEHGFSLVSLIESLLNANHGSTLGFVTHEGSAEPVLNPDPPAPILRQWKLVRDSCMAYAQQMADSPAWECTSDVVTSSLAVPLLLLCRDPKPEEAALFTHWFFDGGREESSLRKVADRMVMKDFAKLMVARLRSQSFADVYLSSPWLSGTIAVSPTVLRGVANFLIRGCALRRRSYGRKQEPD